MVDAVSLTCVTITGADNDTDPASLVALSSEFPFVEWGVLVSLTREDTGRYPSRSWIRRLMLAYDVDLMNRGAKILNFSMHVCGKWSQRIFAGDRRVWDELPEIKLMADRMQVNGQPEGIPRMEFLRDNPKQYIFQWPRTGTFAAACREAGINAIPLFDKSGGRGESHPWQEVPGDGVAGYAGGIGPDNVVSVVKEIEGMTNGMFWIDMENNVRTGDKLDLVKVRAVLEACAPMVTL
jgi:hypothetical protein